MTSGGILLALFLVAVAGVLVRTLAVVVRGGPGPGDPPASRPHVDPAGFPVLSRPRGVPERRHRRSGSAVAAGVAVRPALRRARRGP
ncbi:UNVERIFIED_ORG: hypothetical protein E4P37_19240 [Bacillus sp. AZ43]